MLPIDNMSSIRNSPAKEERKIQDEVYVLPTDNICSIRSSPPK